MKITTVLLDLDGTLLPMDNDAFTKGYFKLLAKKLAPLGYEAGKMVDVIWAGTACMVKNDGSRSNEEAFWEKFAQEYGEERLADRPVFDEFYAVEFQQAQAMCGYDPLAVETIRFCQAHGLSVALATNPIFPGHATESRIRWAGLEPSDFVLYTTYENSTYCKPNPAYYQDLCKRLGVSPQECLMVGNDVGEDMIAETIGMQVFLLTDNLINRKDADITRYPRGGFAELLAFLKEEVKE